MTKIIYFKDSLKIKDYTHSEYLFELDDNNKIIKNSNIIPRYFEYDENTFKLRLENIINKNSIIELNNGFLFYSYIYEINYANFLNQTLPKLTDYLIYFSNYKILIPKKFYTNFHKDIFNILKIHINNIILLEEDYIYILLKI